MVDNNVYPKIKEIKNYAVLNHIPIMVDEGIDFLTTFLIKNKVEHVLEIGTAIGYSAIMMALSSPNVTITTIERDKERYLEAVKNIKKLNLENRITLIFNDALDVKLSEMFDLIFVDAAKGQNIRFFNHFAGNLKVNGHIITDNMNFHGLVGEKSDQITSRSLRGLVRKIQDYSNFLKENTHYKTVFHTLGDGLAVSEKLD